MWVTPNMLDDGHDTTIDYAANWTSFWLGGLLNNTNFNDNRTLILLTFDETETYTTNNHIFALLLGGAIPESARGTIDSTYYTHYSSLSSVEANWGLGSLGRGDTNKYVPFPLSTQTNFSRRGGTTGHSRTSFHSSPTRRTTRTSSSPRRTSRSRT
jgi:hypothetical protein